jgi:hypothetical protein
MCQVCTGKVSGKRRERMRKDAAGGSPSAGEMCGSLWGKGSIRSPQGNLYHSEEMKVEALMLS